MTAKSIQLGDRVGRANGHLAEEIDGQIVLLSIEAGNYYGMDEVGSEIWRLIENPVLVADLCESLAAAYDAPSDVIHKDILAFLERLAEQNLIRINPE